MRCRADALDRIRAAERALECDTRVEATDVIPPRDDPSGLWVLELTIAPEVGGVDEAMMRELVPRGLTVRESRPKGLFWRALVTS